MTPEAFSILIEAIDTTPQEDPDTEKVSLTRFWFDPFAGVCGVDQQPHSKPPHAGFWRGLTLEAPIQGHPHRDEVLKVIEARMGLLLEVQRGTPSIGLGEVATAKLTGKATADWGKFCTFILMDSDEERATISMRQTWYCKIEGDDLVYAPLLAEEWKQFKEWAIFHRPDDAQADAIEAHERTYADKMTQIAEAHGSTLYDYTRLKITEARDKWLAHYRQFADHTVRLEYDSAGCLLWMVYDEDGVAIDWWEMLSSVSRNANEPKPITWIAT